MDISWSIGPADNAWVLQALLWILILWFLVRRYWPHQVPMPKKPSLPPELRPKPTGAVPVAADDPLRPHLFELIAAAINEGAEVKWWDLRDLNYEGRPLPNFRITVERIND